MSHSLSCFSSKGDRMSYKNLVQFDDNGYPTCEEHGAMNCVNKDLTLWRCAECHIGIDIKNTYRFVEREVRGLATTARKQDE